MTTLCAIMLSIRNVMRVTAASSLLFSVPNLIFPACMVAWMFGKREDRDERDEKALAMSFRFMGIPASASAVKTLIAAPTSTNLLVALEEEACVLLLGIINKVNGSWKKAGGDPKTHNGLMVFGAVRVAFMLAALLCNKDKDGDEDKDADTAGTK